MEQDQIVRIRASFDKLTPRIPELADRFHARLFAQHPRLRAMFPRDLSAPKQDFAAGLRYVVRHLGALEGLSPVLMDLGLRHARSGLTPGDLGAAREVLLQTLQDMSGPAWSDQLREDWTEALNVAVAIMVVGAGRSRAHAA